MSTAIRQLGFIGICDHNPQMETCHFKGCDTVLFGEVYILQLESVAADRVETIELCSIECYRKMDSIIEGILSEGDDFIAIIDNGIPEEWS